MNCTLRLTGPGLGPANFVAVGLNYSSLSFPRYNTTLETTTLSASATLVVHLTQRWVGGRGVGSGLDRYK